MISIFGKFFFTNIIYDGIESNIFFVFMSKSLLLLSFASCAANFQAHLIYYTQLYHFTHIEIVICASHTLSTVICTERKLLYQKKQRYRTTSFSATSYYLAKGILVERTKREVAFYERL